MSPLAWPIAAALARFEGAPGVPTVEAIDRVLSVAAGVRFVQALPRPRRRAASRATSLRTLDRSALYDARIVERGEVPTRQGNLHDFMNALVWASFPRAKLAIHRRQHALIQSRIENERLPAARTPEQDTLAMIDEGGIALVTSEGDQCAQAAKSRDADGIRRLVSGGRTVAAVFGHALFEHLARKDLTDIWGRAMILRVPEISAPVRASDIDTRLADAISLRHVDHDAGSAPLVSSVLLSD